MAAKCASKISMACLLWGTFICSFLGLVSSQEPKTPPIQLNRILGESALLPVHITSNNTVSIVKWIFHPRQGEANELGRFSDGKWVRWITSDSFGQHLEMVDVLTLKISNLVVKDSGVYRTHVTFSTGVTESHTFSLAVYEPVREPQVTHKLISNTPDGCNVTLRCQASGKGDFRVSWKRGNPLRALGESPDWHQLSDNGEDLHLFWHRNASDANITCLVSNPADQKNISINLLSLCPAKAARILIAKYWKIQDLPTREEWQMKLMDYMELAEMTGRIRDQGEELVEEEWKKFKVYLQKYCKIKEC